MSCGECGEWWSVVSCEECGELWRVWCVVESVVSCGECGELWSVVSCGECGVMACSCGKLVESKV